MPDDRPYNDAELVAGAKALMGKYAEWHERRPRAETATVLRAVTLMIERRAQIPLLSLIEDLTDPDPCRYDHHGYCRAHSLHPKPCPHERAKRVLAKAHRDMGDGDDG